jgi:hypothetical protein
MEKKMYKNYHIIERGSKVLLQSLMDGRVIARAF